MARRRQGLTSGERKRARLALLAVAVAALLALVVFLAAWGPRGRPTGHAGGGHEHRDSPHGGVLASLGAREPHDHAEAVPGLGGALTIYTLRADAATPRPVERQALTAWARAAGEEKPARVVLVPMPLETDPPGATSRFKGRLPEALWGRDLSVTVPELVVAEGRYRLEFAEVKSPADREGHLAELRRLYLEPGGKYTLADIAANGNATAADKFGEHEAEHDLAPREEGWLCPVAAARSEPGLAWTVAGRNYRFCCSPCVDEFVRLAKERPEMIKPPEAYRRR
jgi:hypothetical protein